MDSCFTCKEYLDCSIRMGCNLVGCVGWEPVDNLHSEPKENNVNIWICDDCINVNECDLAMRNKCLRFSKYMGYHRALKYKSKSLQLTKGKG